MKNQKGLTVKTLSKSNIWDVDEKEVLQMLKTGASDIDFEDNIRRYTDIIKTAFEIEEMRSTLPAVVTKYEARGFTVGEIASKEGNQHKLAIKKRPISRVNDLTYENIRHITAAKLLEVIDRNFGGGWNSLPQSIQDIIMSGFDISTTTLPKEKLHKEGGLYEKKMEDGFEVLEIAKGTWIEAIFAKQKPKSEKIKINVDKTGSSFGDEGDDDEEDDENYNDNDNDYANSDDDDTFDDEKLTEESYRTTFESNPDDLNIVEAEDICDDDNY